MGEGTLDVSRVVEGTRVVVFGGTGFLGKLFWAMLVDRYPNIGKIFLVVRPKEKGTPEARFWSETAESEALEPLRRTHGTGFEAFLREKIVPIDGDMGRPLCGLDESLVHELWGSIDAVVNVAGVVDFNPPLDEGLHANAFGAQNLVGLARALGDVPVFHTSTCYVAGTRKGPILEDDPRVFPFPRAGELGVDAWDPEREIAECLDLVDQANHRSEDAFRQSEFANIARKTLIARGEPAHGEAYDREFARVKRKFVSTRLVEAGQDRATHWGWPNIYTYTKAIGEQVIASSGLPFTIARPACCESCLDFPVRSYNEGVTTSAPLLYLMLKGQVHVLAKHVPLDLIPTDYVVAGMILAFAELLEGSAAPVYQYGASDVNPCTAQRFGELVGIYKRKYYQRRGSSNPLLDALQAHVEPSFVGRGRFDLTGPPAVAALARGVASLMKKTSPAFGSTAKALEDVARRESKIAEILRLFEPFSSRMNGPYDCSNTRAAFARASEADKKKLPWAPESLDWADWMMNVHMPAIETRIMPQMDARLKKEPKALAPHATLVSLVDEMAERHDLALALQQMTGEGLTRASFRDLKERSTAAAAHLQTLGIKKGDRVALAAENGPDWAIAYFGILRAGATAVPMDPALDAAGWAGVLAESGAGIVVWDDTVKARSDVAAAHPGIVALEVGALTEAPLFGGSGGGEVSIEPGDVASLIYTSGTTGRPKGVMLTHANFASLVAALAPIFPLSRGDAVLSVLPLHHTFEFTCGLLLPLSRGARIVYVGELTGERIASGLRESRAAAMVGVPALWQMLERRILQQVNDRGPFARAAFDLAGEANRWLSSNVGVDAGRILFGAVHSGMGGKVRWLISGGAALPRETLERFAGLGLRLTEGYGLTEAAPVLTVARPGKRLEPGVGKPVPGVELKIADPDDQGVGEVVARGPNVMIGYTDGDATRSAIDAEGWLYTGDLGRIDRKGRLEIVGRLKDVVISATGENVYPDDVEKRLGLVPHIAELAIVGVEVRGSERVGCLAVPEAGSGDRAEHNARARAALRVAIAELPLAQRPSIVHFYEAPLPRTATRKVKRDDVRAILGRLLVASGQAAEAGEEVADERSVRVAIAASAGVPVEQVTPGATLRGELGFDSLMLTELLEGIETRYGFVDPQRLQACVTVGDVAELVRSIESRPRQREPLAAARAPEITVVLPEPVRAAGKAVIGKLQDLFYGEVMKPRVLGRAYVPHNRNVIVVANHSSHLDMGLVRHALGKYGEDVVSLAAQDYFFGRGVSRAFFENLTNLKPIDRKASLRQAIRQASDVIELGKTVLVFPEGTRGSGGEILEFKPLVGHLALVHGIDILPIFLGGTQLAMPKGAALPTHREILARIGPPLCVGDLRRLTQGMTPSDAAREVARLAREAVLALRDAQVLDLASTRERGDLAPERENPLVKLFAELEGKFRAGEVERPVSYYVSLGSEDLAKWTVRVDALACDVRPGKPEGGQADCVLKTSPELFTKIVREAYMPSPADFVSGAIKSNDVALLMTFQKVFQLDCRS